MSLTNYGEARVVEALNGEGPTFPSSWHIKLHVGDPGEDATGNPSTNTTRNSATFTSTTNVLAMAAPETWATWASGTEEISWVSVWDNTSAGNPWFVAQLTSPRTVQDDDDFVLDTLTLTLD